MVFSQLAATVGVFLLGLSGLVLGEKAPSLPANPDTVCSHNALANLLATATNCISPLIFGKGTEECCNIVEEVFGLEAATPTANCLCVPNVWVKTETAAVSFGAKLREFLDDCK